MVFEYRRAEGYPKLRVQSTELWAMAHEIQLLLLLLLLFIIIIILYIYVDNISILKSEIPTSVH